MISVLELFAAFILGAVVGFLAFCLACFSGDDDNEKDIEDEEICKYCEQDCSSCRIRNKEGEV